MRHLSSRPPSPSAAAALCGFTLVEIAVVGVLLVILVGLAVPHFTRAVEQARVDHAAARLHAIWTAQRLHWLAFRRYADSLAALEANQFLDPARADATGGLDFDYSISSADETAFSAEAEPGNGVRWPGSLAIDQTGRVGGQIQASDGSALTPDWL